MQQSGQPILSVITRRFRARNETAVRTAIVRLRDLAERQPGFLGAKDSYSPDHDLCQLVTIFAFRTQDALVRWDSIPERERLIAELDRHCQHVSPRSGFEALDLLAPRGARVSKPETVALLIFWIMLLQATIGRVIAEVLPAATGKFWGSLIVVSLNVGLISYLLLPWSARLLCSIKHRLAHLKQPLKPPPSGADTQE